MTGVTTGQTSFATATDSDDVEAYSTGALVNVLQSIANLFESATGHDHTGAGKGKPIGSAGIASGITLTSPHFTSPVVDSGGLILAGAPPAAGASQLTLGYQIATTANAGTGGAPPAQVTEYLLIGLNTVTRKIALYAV